VALSYLVDTSVLTRLGATTVADRLKSMVGVGIARCSVSDLEIGFSARSQEEWDKLIKAIDVFDLVSVEGHHFSRAGNVQRLLASEGLRGRKVPDLLVAAVAEERSLTVLHYDADFDHIASATGQTVEWVVPRGSID